MDSPMDDQPLGPPHFGPDGDFPPRPPMVLFHFYISLI